MCRRQRILAGLVFWGVSAPSLAAHFSLTEKDFFAPMPTVLSASRLVQPLSEASAAMTVIDREMIEASSALGVPEVLRLVPGFQVTFVEGVEAISSYHGFADSFPRRMQVMVDGRSVYDPGLNGVVWAALPLTLDQVERIEVVRGPNAAAYGSNAFLGTINIITRRPETSERLRLRALAGSEDTAEGEIGHAGQVGPFAYLFNASHSETNGFPDKSDDSRSQILNFQGTYRPTLDDSLNFHAGVRETDFDSEAFRVPRKRTYRSHFQQLVWNRTLSADEDFRLQLYHNYYQSPDNVIFNEDDLGAVNVDYSLTTHRYDVELQHRFSPGQDWRISWGGGLRWDRTKGAGIFDRRSNFERDQLRLFANAEWRLHPDAVVNLGLMAEDFSDMGDYYSPRLGLNWHVHPHHTLRFSAARAYRMPTMLELHGELKVDLLATPGSPDLVELFGSADNSAEKIHSFELGYLVEAPAIRGSFDVRLFHNEVTPFLDDATDISLPGRPLRFLEAGALRVSGFEAQARLRPFDDTGVYLAYAYAEADGSRIRVTNADNEAVQGVRRMNPTSNRGLVPEHTLTAMLTQRLPGDWRLSGTFSYVSAMEWMGEGDEVDGHGRVDLKLAKRLRLSAGEVELSLNVHNLLDDPYWEFNPPNPDVGVSGNLSERRIHAAIRYTLH